MAAPINGSEATLVRGGGFSGNFGSSTAVLPNIGGRRGRSSRNDSTFAGTGADSTHAVRTAVTGNRRSVMLMLIAAELLLAVALAFALFYTSWTHIVDRRTEAVTASVAGFDTAPLAASASSSYTVAMEQVYKVVDETVWTKVNANYRVGPAVTYEKEGTLNKYASVKRTGLTYNKWSRVEINDETYYIRSRNLTTEAPLVTASGAKGDYQRYALSLMSSYGWAESEIIPLIKLWDRESGWNPSSHNGSSGAHGIPQALPASKMASEGSDYYTNGNTQIRWGLGYIRGRYGSPSNAWAHFCSYNWY